MGQSVKGFFEARRSALALGCVVALTGAAALYSFYSFQRKKAVARGMQQLADVARERELEILNYLDDQQVKIVDLALQDEVAASFEGTVNKDFFERYEKSHQGKDVLLLRPTGELIFSLNNAGLVGINLARQHKDSSLAQSFNRAMMTVGVDLSAFEFFEPLGKAALFVCAPVFKKKKLMGVVAVQLNDRVLADMVGNYKNLGRTGEVVLAEQQDAKIQLVFPVRHEEAAPLSSAQEAGSALQQAVLGGRGRGVEEDRQQKVGAVWRFLPDVAWGLVTQMNFAEMSAPVQNYYRYAQRSFLLGLLLLALLLFSWARAAAPAFFANPRAVRNGIIIALVLMGCATGLLVYRSLKLRNQIEYAVQQDAQEKVAAAERAITEKLQRAEELAQTVASDLSAGRLKKEDINIRLNRDLQEHSALIGMAIAYQPFAYDPAKKLYAPAVVRAAGGVEQQELGAVYDYTQEERPGQPITRWYTMPAAQGAQWVEPYLEPITGAAVAAYSVPFFDETNKEKPVGVVTVMYPVKKIQEIVEDLGMGQSGYGFIISRAGYFLYHPVSEYVEKQKTIFEIADSLNNVALRKIGEQATRGKTGEARYFNEITAQDSSVFFEPLSKTGWTVGVTFIREEDRVQLRLWRHYNIWILVCVMVALLLLGLLLTGVYRGVGFASYAVLSTIVLALGMAAMWVLITRALLADPVRGRVVVDKVGLNTFLDGVKRRAATSYEALPITVSTGIYVRSLNLTSPMQVEFTADVWQVYDEQKHAGIAREIVFPQAIKMTTTPMYHEKNGTTETIGWTAQGVLAQRFDYSRYPFDTKTVEIMLDHKDKMKNVLLVPDFESYRVLNPVTRPGVDEQVKVLGYKVKKSFFSFNAQKPKVDFGISESQVSRTELNFNIALRRNLIDAVVVFLLPLLVVLVALFAALWFTFETPEVNMSYRPLAAYTAVVFALVLLHRTFREKLPSGEVIYLEYFFFFTYITIVVLMLNALFLYSQTFLRQRALHMAYCARFLFWPAEVLAWFITTVIIFYG